MKSWSWQNLNCLPLEPKSLGWNFLLSQGGFWRLQLIIKTIDASFEKFPSSSAVGAHSSPHWFLKSPELEQVCFCIETAEKNDKYKKASASGLSENQPRIKPLIDMKPRVLCCLLYGVRDVRCEVKCRFLSFCSVLKAGWSVQHKTKCTSVRGLFWRVSGNGRKDILQPRSVAVRQVDGDMARSIKRRAPRQLRYWCRMVWGKTSAGFFHGIGLLGTCVENSFPSLACGDDVFCQAGSALNIVRCLFCWDSFAWEREYIDSIKWRVKGRGRGEKEDHGEIVKFLSNHDVLWYGLRCVWWLPTNSQKRKVARFLRVSQVPVASDPFRWFHLQIFDQCVIWCIHFFKQLYSQLSAACAQGACDIVLGGRIYTPDMFGEIHQEFHENSLLVTENSLAVDREEWKTL